MKIKGIDTNHHHAIKDHAAVKRWLMQQNEGKNPGFDMPRLGYSSRSGNGGLILDRQGLDTIKRWNSLGVPCGTYVYCYDKTPEAARRTVREALDKLKGCKLEYPIAYDMEYGTHSGKSEAEGGYKYDSKANRERNTDIMLAALQEIEAHGYYAMIYCSRNFYQNFLNGSRLKDYDVWEAAYPNDNSQVANGMHQYSSKGAVPGIVGNVDLNVAYKDYPQIIRAAGLNGFGKQPEQDKSPRTIHLGAITWGDFCAVEELLLPVIKERHLENLYKVEVK